MNFGYSIIICSFLSILLCKSGSGNTIICPTSKKLQKFKIEFHISTKRKVDQYYTLNSNKDLKDFDFSPEKPTAIIIHGFLSSHKKKPLVAMRDAFLQWDGSMNIITVNWNEGCKLVWKYDQSVANTESTAWEVKNFTLRLMRSYKNVRKEKWGKFHFLGHSLGAHVAGRAAAHLDQNNVRIHRVTGLDPALPCFKDSRYGPRLNRSNADFVDVIHTNGDLYGIFEPLGHVDFYVNGGKYQPGCYISLAGCDHNRAIDYFTQSIIQQKRGCRFWALPWDINSRKINVPANMCTNKKCQELGINARNVTSGMTTFFVSVNKAAPYCRQH